ncbi:hypothetical protein LR010_00900 [Candidatus Gracilibacteria bacterium]|nr:hypothetical protein [Candidatus Gracilibacteria bacterium]
MFGRKILFLAAGYVAGNMVASVYSGGKKKAKKAQGKEDVKLMVENFLNTQKNFIADVEDKYLSDENKKKLSEKKQDFMKASEKYIAQGEKLLSEVSKNEKIAAGKNKAGGFLGDALKKGKQLLAELKSGNEEEAKKI